MNALLFTILASTTLGPLRTECMCFYPPVSVAFYGSEIIFYGEVISRVSENDQSYYKFEVLEPLKGINRETKTIKVYQEGTSCDFSIPSTGNRDDYVGTRLILFSWRDAKTNLPTTNQCLRFILESQLNPKSKTYLAELRSGAIKAPNEPTEWGPIEEKEADIFGF